MKLQALSLVLLSGIVWAQVPQSGHVWVVTEENHSYESVIGNTSMPYFNSLAAKYGLATQYYSEQHNSLSALMWLVAGQPVTGNDDTTSCYNVNNIARQLIAQGFKWRSYQEDLPYAGFGGLYNLNYVRRHNPIIDFTDACASSQKINSVPYTQLASDIADHATPNYAYVTPNLQHDAHNGTLAEADIWLSEHLPTILGLPEFKAGGDGLLFIVWDEADLTNDNRCASIISSGCGGRLATLVIGPQVKRGYRSSLRYDHSNLLRTVCDAMGISSCPGAAAVESPMSDFFNTVSIAVPLPNVAVASPVPVVASTSDSSTVVAMAVYVDNLLRYKANVSAVNLQLPMGVGTHHLVAESWDSAGGIHTRAVDVTVQSEAVLVTNPAPKATVPSSVQVAATGGGQIAVSKMQLYVDGVAKFQSSGNKLNTTVSLSAGDHTISVEASDSTGNLTSENVPVTSASPSVKIISPSPNSSVSSPVYVSATTVDPTPVVALAVYVDNILKYIVHGTGVQTTVPLSRGKHWLVVQDWNQAGGIHNQGFTVNVN